MRRNYVPQRRRRSPLPLLLALLVLLAGLAVWLSTVDTEVPTQRIEQDVTNEALAR